MQNAVRPKRMAVLLAVLLGWTALSSSPVLSDSRRAEYRYGNRRLVLEALDDNLLPFRWLASDSGQGDVLPLSTSPMVLKTDYSGPSQFSDDGQGTLTTASLLLRVDLRGARRRIAVDSSHAGTEAGAGPPSRRGRRVAC